MSSRGPIGLKSCCERSGSAGAACFWRAKGPPAPQALKVPPRTIRHAAVRNLSSSMGFFTTYGRLPHREPHAEVRSPCLGLENLDGAVMRVDEFGHHRQFDSRSFHMASLRRLSLIKSFEYPIALIGRNTRPAVHDVQSQLIALGARMNRYGTAARGELDRVGQ